MNTYTFILDAHDQEVVSYDAESVGVDRDGARLYVGSECVGHVRRYDAFRKEPDESRCNPGCRCSFKHP